VIIHNRSLLRGRRDGAGPIVSPPFTYQNYT
jgi:hypothetical protein